MRKYRSRVLFVCANNICRSPIVEGVFRAAAKREGLAREILVDSAGTYGNHRGQPPDPRAVRAARARGYDLSRIRARSVVAKDFKRFDWILAMDEANLRALFSLRPPTYEGHLGLLMDLAPDAPEREIPDPYFGDSAQFERVLDLAEMAAEGLLVRVGSHPTPCG